MASKEISIAPLTGVLDLRTSPDSIPQGGVRMRQNLATTGDGKLRRGSGFQKLLSEPGYNNADFHDQLLLLAGADAIRQPVTMIVSAESTQKTRSLYVATQSRIARLNEYSGNYKLLGSGFGGEPIQSANAPRFVTAQIGDYLVFTNDFDRPKYHLLENMTQSDSALYEFEDLVTIGLRRAKLVWSWHNVLFFANVEMDGERAAYRIVWGNYNDPTSLDPAKADSIAGYKDLYTYETILAGAPSGNSFLIYTTHGIWEMYVTGGAESFSFRRLYNAEENNKKSTLAFPNCLINMGDSHLFVANEDDGIGLYVYSQFYTKPERSEWLHRASALFDKVDKTKCEAHCAGIHGDEVIISMAEVGAANDCPNLSLRINTTYKTCDVVDKGFTAFCNHNPQNSPTLRDFILQNEICGLYELYQFASIFDDEGLPKNAFATDAPFAPQHIFTDQVRSAEGGLGITMEDITQPTASADSLCALLGNQTVDDTCAGCKSDTIFVAALSDDWCLKQFNPDIFYREICANPTAVGRMTIIGYETAAASYTLEGITSLLRFAPLYVKDSGIEATMFELDYLSATQDPPSQIGLRVGISGQVGDPNTDECRIVWHQHSLKDLTCISGRTATEHRALNTKPSETLHWNFIRNGKILYFELRIDGVGGDAQFSKVNADVERYTIKNY